MKARNWARLIPVIEKLSSGEKLEINERRSYEWVPVTEDNVILLLDDGYSYRDKLIKGTWYLDFKYETGGEETVAGSLSRRGYKHVKPQWVNAPNYDCDMSSERFVPDPEEDTK